MSIATEPTPPEEIDQADTAPTATPPRPRSRDTQHPAGMGLAQRALLGAAALVVLSLGLGLGFATWRANRVTVEKMERDLALVPETFANLERLESAAQRQQLVELAERPGTKALLGEVRASPETFRDTAQELAQAISAEAVLFFDARGALLARSDRPVSGETGRDFSGVSWVRQPLTDGRPVSAYILLVRERRLQRVAAAPVTQGEGNHRLLLGVVAGAFPLGDARAKELSRILGGEAAILANLAGKDAPPELALVAATEPLRYAQPRELLAEAALQALFGRGLPYGPIESRVRGTDWVGQALPLKTGAGEPIAAFVVARSKDAELESFHRIRRGMLWIGALTLLVALPLGRAFAQRITGPVTQLAEAAEAIRQGRLEVALPRARGDEVGTLARAFGEMVEELKEKAALEAWVAEMLRRPGDVTRPSLQGRPAAETGGLEIGRLFAGRYLVKSVLGRGGMGTVFRVEDRELEQEIALKLLRAEVFGDDREADRALRQEIRMARMITHPNVVRVHDLGEADSRRFLTMEYVAGTTLAELLDRHGRLDLRPGLQIAKQVCRGLQAVHAGGVIHGDLKPRNVMVMSSGVVKLMDFGVARGAQPSAGDPVGAGSPHYMSPEQAKGADADPRSDLYSAGVTFFEMFSGRLPFEATSPAEMVRLHQHEPAPPLRSLRPELPASLERLVQACLAKERALRPAGAADLERALMRVHTAAA